MKYNSAAIEYNADDVWAASAAAHRINDGYVKGDAVINGVAKKTNRELVYEFLKNIESLSELDRELGSTVRNYYKQFTFRILQGKTLSSFNHNAMIIANRDTIKDSYDVAIITSIISGYQRSLQQDEIEYQINTATGGFIGQPGDKIVLDLKVLRVLYSQKYGTGVYYITGINSNDQVIFFRYREEVPVNQLIKVKGTVKAHRKNSTQLTRVKLV
jgi:hypothetical protein